MQTAEDRYTELFRVMESFEYFCDGYVYIEDKDKNCAIKLDLWPEQRKVIPSLMSDPLLFLLKTRQVGLTWLCAALVLWLGIRHPLFLAIIISASEDHAKEFLQRVNFIRKRLPSWIYPPIKSETLQILTFAHEDDLEATIKSLPTTLMGAESKTPNLLIIDEAHTIREVKSIYNASYPGIEQAKGRVIVIANSVKTGPGWGWVRDTYTASMSGLNRFKRIFLPWYAHPGRPADFRQRMKQDGMDEQDIIQHYPETEAEAISSVASSYFGDVLDRHIKAMDALKAQGFIGGIRGYFKRNAKKEIEFVPDRNGIAELFKYPYRVLDPKEYPWKYRYCAGSDVSEGLGSTFSVSHFKDRVADEIVCRLRSNRVDAYNWAEQLKLACDYYENALICVERTGAGQTTVKRLDELKANQYVQVTSGTTSDGLSTSFGWHESNQSKHELCGDLRQWLRETKGTVWDAVLLSECQTFIQDEAGKLVPEEGKFSDCVMSAGCMVQADKFLPAPEQIIPKDYGWRERLQAEKGASAWAK
jgi:hypothetical protein